MSHRGWYRLHLATWLAIPSVAVAIVYCQVVPEVMYEWSHAHYGWPMVHGGQVLLFTPSFHQPGIEIQTSKFAANMAVCVCIAVSTAFVVERACRRGRRFSLSTLFAAATVVAMLMTLQQIEAGYFLRTRHSSFFEGELPPVPIFVRYPWYVAAPLLLGLACALYSAGWVVVRLSGYGWRRTGCFVAKQNLT